MGEGERPKLPRAETEGEGALVVELNDERLDRADVGGASLGGNMLEPLTTEAAGVGGPCALEMSRWRPPDDVEDDAASDAAKLLKYSSFSSLAEVTTESASLVVDPRRL